MVPLKYPSSFWRTLEMLLNNCINNCYHLIIIVATNVAAQATTFSITDTKLYVPVVTLFCNSSNLSFCNKTA